ncbi:aspartyl protease family protein [Flavobacterium tiangeerense]|uniref:Aspartyl protease family protein n=1 Tax=Flavobacterium tiangeerense TaxID=459471 RepID=A0ABY3FMI7_9FLAO|nr:retropepsin-like aspartic protease [Flavobacterium tiangeerense]TWI02377.1 aspartyl protease family protein [Flavobacterium tiangeerense]
MRKILFIFVTITLFINFGYSQQIIEMEKINGTYQIPCKVNGIPMKFIFDTGATDVTISVIEAKFLLKQGLITKEDFIENTNYKIANGDIIEGTKIYLKTIDIDGIILRNIQASIIFQQNAPLLLGQSAIEQLGKYSIDRNKLIIENPSSKNEQQHPEVLETINWINEQFENNIAIPGSKYFLKNIMFIKNQPFIILGSEEDFCGEPCEIPIKKIKTVTFQEMRHNSGDIVQQQLRFETKNNEEIIWFKNEESNCGQEGTYMFINLNNSVNNNNLIYKIKEAFTRIMMIYGNDGKE